MPEPSTDDRLRLLRKCILASAELSADVYMNWGEFYNLMRDEYFKAVLRKAKGHQIHAAQNAGVHRNTVVRYREEARHP